MDIVISILKNFYRILEVSIVISIILVFVFRYFRKDKHLIQEKIPEHLVKEEVLFLLKKNERIKAIKLLRKSISMELKGAVDFIDNIEETDISESVSSDKLIKEILELIEKKKKIEAIRLVRGIKKFDLKRAKEFVEAIEKRYGH